ncbi:hypothetical protein Q0F98_05755 [Paenibacillus amylolyticus]|nr:hypothetical protein Q0F98_05755 [Paenibacillus amylolyticus]
MIDNPKTLIDKMLERISDVSKVKELERNRDDIGKLIKDKESSKARYIDLYAEGIIKSKEELSIKLEPVDSEISELNKELSLITDNLELNKRQNKNTSPGGHC